MLKKIIIALFLSVVAVGAGAYFTVQKILTELPDLSSLKAYKPLLVTQVYDRNGIKIGEFSREKRILVPYSSMPKHLIQAFLAAEDDSFFEHKGVNYQAIMRAAIANFRAGQTVQGGSTITQQVAKTLLLTSEKTIDRKVRELILSHRMEESLSKEDILYLYLNQIYFGQSAYGVGAAAEVYFRKPVEKLTLAESAILAGLPKAPSAYSPIRNPSRAKERQTYVLSRMAAVGFIDKETQEKTVIEPVKVYTRENYENYAPHFMETVRLLLISKLSEDQVLNDGLRVTTSLDFKMQKKANEAVLTGLKEVDKRQGFRGPKDNFTEPKAVGAFLLKTRDSLIAEAIPERVLEPTGKFKDYGPLDLKKDLAKDFPFYLKEGMATEGIVSKVDDKLGLTFVRVAEIEGLIDMDSMTWARKPDPEKRWDFDLIKKPSDALKTGDVILVHLKAKKFSSARLDKLKPKKSKPAIELPNFANYAQFELDQDPLVDGALISIDQKNQDLIAMVGGWNFEKSKFNRSIQAARQTGSSFKSIVYASALDKKYTPVTPIMDAPLVYEEAQESSASEDAEGQEDAKIWRPTNHSKKFGGDIIFRNALVQSLNVPTVKIIEDVGVPWSMDYAQRLGIYSPLNPDFTLALGSSSVTLYEMTRAFSIFPNLGKKSQPRIILKVQSHSGGKVLDSVKLDDRFQEHLKPIEEKFEERRKKYLAQLADNPDSDLVKKEPPIFFEDPNQLISPQTSYMMVQLLKGVVEDPRGTGGKARAVGREVAGKTGTTNGYFDAWFIGFSPQITTGVWVGFDQEKTLGKGEVGGRSALPIWVEYMKTAHDGLPQMTFPIPEGIVFANVDSETGFLATAATQRPIRMAFKDGTEPKEFQSQGDEDVDFYKRDVTE